MVMQNFQGVKKVHYGLCENGKSYILLVKTIFSQPVSQLARASSKLLV